LLEYELVARIFLERRDLRDDSGRVIQVVDDGGVFRRGSAGECTPPLDVVETARAIEVVLDIPGVVAESITVVFSRNTLVIAGQKRPAACEHHAAAFHVAERTFGHFARAVRLGGAYDAGAARATLSAGELRVVLPRLEERRGTEIRIPVQAD
jgi:HSP20 family protein